MHLHCRPFAAPALPPLFRSSTGDPRPARPASASPQCRRVHQSSHCRALTQLSLPPASLYHSPLPLQSSVSDWLSRAFTLVPLGQLSPGSAAFRGPIATRALRALPYPAPVSFSDYRYGTYQRWVPLEALSLVQHSRAGEARPSSSCSPRASP